MTLDIFELIINLVALGMGVACVPIRALALYSRKKNLRRVAWPSRFERELVVVVRRNREIPEHVRQYIENVLFRAQCHFDRRYRDPATASIEGKLSG